MTRLRPALRQRLVEELGAVHAEEFEGVVDDGVSGIVFRVLQHLERRAALRVDRDGLAVDDR